MGKIFLHCEDCEKVLGKPFKKVHEWLDEFAKKYPPPLYLETHRRFRHHDKGIQEVIKKWGYYAGQAAKLHIIRDNQFYVYFDINKIREDDIEELYKKALGFCDGPK